MCAIRMFARVRNRRISLFSLIASLSRLQGRGATSIEWIVAEIEKKALIQFGGFCFGDELLLTS